MSDLISRQAAIDAIKSRKTAEQSRAGIMRNAVVDFCIDIVKKLPSAQPKTCAYWDRESNFCALHRPSAQTEMPWIPCSKKLPEKEGPYLISNSRHTFEAMFLGGEWYSRELDLLLDGVLAWMPLPEPYREDGDQG